MREILFRGKQMVDNEWIYGGAVHQTDSYGDKVDEWFIIDGTYTNDYDIGEPIRVIPETIGQYTGLIDKNGVKIFEGDIIRDSNLEEHLLGDWRESARAGIAIVRFGIHEVPSDDQYCWGRAYGFYFDGDTFYPTPVQYKMYDEDWEEDVEFEVIGNIHENPELAERSKHHE